MGVARPCYVFGMAVEPQSRINCYTERLQLGCNLQPAAGDLDRSYSGSRSELRCCAEEDGLRLVRVELQIVTQGPRPDRSWRTQERIAVGSSNLVDGLTK